MSQLVSFLIALWLSTAAAQLGILSVAKKTVFNEAQAVIDPVGKSIVFIGNTQCATVKKLVGVDYDSYVAEEPDLSRLTLMFITREVSVTFNLSSAATTIPKSPLFNPANPFRIFIHGFTDDPTKDSYKVISSSFLAQGDHNILALDSSSLIRWIYIRATTMVRFIGELLGQLLVALYKAGLDPYKIHLIGHSLGSHIAGFAGRFFFKATGIRIGRISGLDPAGPCFANIDVTLRLNKDYAEFVDVSHSDAGVYGLIEAIGHIDSYLNGGSEQPDCLLQTCSHSRVWLVYAESVINENAFIGVQCNSWKEFREGQCDYNNTSIIGHSCPPESRGTYYLQTSDESPYGRGAKGLKYENNVGLVRNVKDALKG